ncbi:MAG: uroporphyrinogen decarboxylase family protein [Eubacteriales bacterium]|nr:uroporphyrinogen decarboxylase family protein [Eubacteriales bacterium]
MDIRKLLWDAARPEHKRALPILSFPAAQKLGVSVESLVKSAGLQARAMETIARETDTLAALSLMDLSVEAEAFGAQVRFSEHEVPAIVGQLVSDEDEAEALAVPDLTAGRAMLCVEAVRTAKQHITDKPVIAGMIGPYSLAGRLCDVTEIMYLCYDEPETVYTVLDKATQYLIRYGRAMKDAGADGIMMAEPLAGILSPDMAEEFSMPYVKRVIDALQDEGFAVLYHNCGNAVSRMLEGIYALGAAGYHFGNAVDMADILARTPADVLVMGNIDPAGEFAGGTAASITAATRSLMAQCGQYPNFVPSSGCDIPAHAKWENIQAFFAAVRG